jgi:hypothetical protein
MRDPFAQFLREKRFTPNAVVRDTSQMSDRLRRRRFKFGGDIELSASPEALKNKIQIEFIAADDGGAADAWTRIIIRERLSGE